MIFSPLIKKRYAHLLLLLLIVNTGIAQDQLIRKDSSVTLVKLVEINTREIKYRRYDSPAGPVYMEKRERVSRIVHENGMQEIMSKAKEKNNAAVPYRSDSAFYRYHNNIAFNFSDLVNSELSVTYQLEFKKHFSIIVPLGIGFATPEVTQYVDYRINPYYRNDLPAYTITRKQFDLGIGINYYLSKRKRINYYIGPLFQLRQYSGTLGYPYHIHTSATNTDGYVEQAATMVRYSAGLNTGFLFRISRRLTFSVYASMSYKTDDFHYLIKDPIDHHTVYPYSNNHHTAMWIGFNLGFNF